MLRDLSQSSKRSVGLSSARCVTKRRSHSVLRTLREPRRVTLSARRSYTLRALRDVDEVRQASSDVVAKHLACTESTALDSLAQPQLLAH